MLGLRRLLCHENLAWPFLFGRPRHKMYVGDHHIYCPMGNAKIAIMLAFHVAQGSADRRRRVSQRDGTMTDISLQKTAKTAGTARGRPFPKGQSGNPAG